MIRNIFATHDFNLENFSALEIISAWFKLAYKNGMAVALWRLPGCNAPQLVMDTSSSLHRGKIDLEESAGGFLFAPFENSNMAEDIFLKAQVHYRAGQNTIEFSSLSKSNQENLLNQLKSELESANNSNFLHFSNKHIPSTSELQYLKTVENALASIRQDHLQKVVPSVTRNVKITSEFNSLDTFERLCTNYPDAFISLVTAPGLGTWMGASPEPIIEVDQSKIFTTVALAGTQAYSTDISVQDAAWKQKEIEEQALVSRYIINCFKKIRLREFVENGPKTVVAGNLLHLKTTYKVDMEEANFPLLGSVMLELLHPTSAVCGMPREAALKFIKRHENFDREFFSGYLGPVNLNLETHLFVNLRCMQLGKQHAVLYAGAGVTEDSLPQNEWVETQLKCDTLIDVLEV